jgi:hypothetical protein
MEVFIYRNTGQNPVAFHHTVKLDGSTVPQLPPSYPADYTLTLLLDVGPKFPTDEQAATIWRIFDLCDCPFPWSFRPPARPTPLRRRRHHEDD